MQTHTNTVFVSDTDSQTPQVMLQLGIVSYTRMIESLAIMALHANHKNGMFYGGVNEVPPDMVENTQALIPNLARKHEGTTLSVIPAWSLNSIRVSHLMWPLDPLSEYARFRNRMTHKHLVGDESHTPPLVYAALHAMHEYRVSCIVDSICGRGPTFGSATPWWTEDWGDLVKSWPDRWDFVPRIWSPMPINPETDRPYAAAVAEWKAKKDGK